MCHGNWALKEILLALRKIKVPFEVFTILVNIAINWNYSILGSVITN